MRVDERYDHGLKSWYWYLYQHWPYDFGIEIGNIGHFWAISSRRIGLITTGLLT